MNRRWKGRVDPTSVKFVGFFFVLVLALTLLIQVAWVDTNIIGPYTEALTRIGGRLLGLFGYQVQVHGTLIRQGTFAVDIRRGCDGVVASILLISACLAYPFSWRDRLLGTAAGYGLIFVLNMIRIVGLFAIGVDGSIQTFNFFHTYVSQFAVIALTMVFWVFWASKRAVVAGR